MKKIYTVPQASETALEIEDIITSSGIATDDQGDGMTDEWGNG